MAGKWGEMAEKLDQNLENFANYLAELKATYAAVGTAAHSTPLAGLAKSELEPYEALYTTIP